MLPFQKLLHRGVREGTTPFPGLLHFTLDTYLILLIKRYQVPFLKYDPTWELTQVSHTISEHFTHKRILTCAQWALIFHMYTMYTFLHVHNERFFLHVRNVRFFLIYTMCSFLYVKMCGYFRYPQCAFFKCTQCAFFSLHLYNVHFFHLHNVHFF